MYSYEARMKAIRLYIRYGRAATATVRELGYPAGTIVNVSPGLG